MLTVQTANESKRYYAVVADDLTASFTVEGYSERVSLSVVTQSGGFAQSISHVYYQSTQLAQALVSPASTDLFSVTAKTPTYGLDSQGLIIYNGTSVANTSATNPNYAIKYNGDLSQVTSITINYALNKKCDCGGLDVIAIRAPGASGNVYLAGQSYAGTTYNRLNIGTFVIGRDKLDQVVGNEIYICYNLVCSGNNANHVGTYLALGDITFEVTNTSFVKNKLLVANEYILSTDVTVYESEFYGELKNINVETTAEDGTNVAMNLYQNGFVVASNVSATVSNGVATYDASALKLTGSVQVEVLGEIPVTNVKFDTIDSLDLGESLYNGFINYDGGFAVNFKIPASWFFTENGQMTSPWSASAQDTMSISYANMAQNVVSISIASSMNNACTDGGVDTVLYKVSGHDNVAGLTSGEELGVIENTTVFTAEMLSDATEIAVQLSKFGCTAYSTTDHETQEYIDFGVLTANLSYTATTATISK